MRISTEYTMDKHDCYYCTDFIYTVHVYYTYGHNYYCIFVCMFETEYVCVHVSVCVFVCMRVCFALNGQRYFTPIQPRCTWWQLGENSIIEGQPLWKTDRQSLALFHGISIKCVFPKIEALMFTLWLLCVFSKQLHASLFYLRWQRSW